MELSNAQQHQEIYQTRVVEMGTDSLENMLICTKAQQEMRKPRPQQEQALKCPRCDSTNTKFCYYNNYSLTQPRYFCKSCRRYWTNGGTLRNVPVGGSCRKNKRPSSSSSSKRSISVNSDTHNQQQLLPHHHHHQPHLLNSSSDTLQSPFSAFSSHMSSYDNEYPTTHDLSHVFPRLLQKQSACGYESAEYDHHHQQHNHTLEHNLSLLGNYSNNTHFGNIMGLNNAADTRNNNNNISGHGFLEGLKANLLNNNNTASSTNFHNLYNGFANNNNSSVSNINGDQIMIPYENLSSNFGSKTSALKQEDHQLNDNNRSSQVLWGAAAAGFPWHQISSHNNNIGGVHGDNNNMVNDIDLVRENINVFAAPVWHGLINSPLM